MELNLNFVSYHYIFSRLFQLSETSFTWQNYDIEWHVQICASNEGQHGIRGMKESIVHLNMYIFYNEHNTAG